MPVRELNQTIRSNLNIPSHARVIACFGPLTRRANVKDAIWAGDILKVLYDDVYLVILGAGPERARLQKFADDIEMTDRVRFVPRLAADLMLQLVDILWIPGLESPFLPAGFDLLCRQRPVVAARLANIAPLLSRCTNYRLVPPGDKLALVRETKAIIKELSGK